MSIVKILETDASAVAVDKDKGKITFHYLLQGKEFKPAIKSPSYFQVVELVCKNYLNNFKSSSGTVNPEEFDLMFAYNKDRNRGILYLGHFREGIV